MATEILRAYGWENGNSMIPLIDSDGVREYVSNLNPHTGTYSYFIQPRNGSSTSTRFPVSGTPDNLSVSVWVDLGTSWARPETNRDFWIRARLTSGEFIEIRFDYSTKTFDAYVDESEVAGGSVVLSESGWFHVQFYAVIADSGSIGVKINGHQSINYSGDTLPAGASAEVDYLYIYSQEVQNSAYPSYIDDLVYGTGGYLGDLRCMDIRPSADTAVDDWTPSSGDNYSTIDETPASDADYNESSVDGDADELAMTDFDGVTYIPVATTAWVRARQDAGVGDSIKVGVDSNGTDDVSAEQALSNSWEYYFHTNDDNPDDAAEWADADIDALKLRYESVIP